MDNKKIYQKTLFFKWVTVGGIASILFLQIISLFSIYNNMSKIIERNINDAFSLSMEEYRDRVLHENYTKDLKFQIKSLKNEKNIREEKDYKYDYTGKLTIDDVMNKVIGMTIADEKYDLDLTSLENILRKNLMKSELDIPFGLTVYPVEKKNILEQSKNFKSQNFDHHSSRIEFDINREVQASFKDTHKVIFGKMIWYLVVSFIIFIIVAISFVYQLKIIIRQKKIEKIRQDFVDSMTHELKHPLQGALSLTEILLNPYFSNSEERRNEAILKIKNNLQAINLSIESILEKTYSDDLEYSAQLKLSNIKNIVNDIVSNLSLTYSNKPIKFNVSFDLAKEEFLLDPVHFPNAIKNVVENAIKYSKENIEINIKVFNDSEQLNIVIEDNGIGIKPENIELIFDKFFRVQQKGYGFGLGLSYVKWVCKIHKGEVSVNSVYNKGSVFTIQIPILK